MPPLRALLSAPGARWRAFWAQDGSQALAVPIVRQRVSKKATRGMGLGSAVSPYARPLSLCLSPARRPGLTELGGLAGAARRLERWHIGQRDSHRGPYARPPTLCPAEFTMIEGWAHRDAHRPQSALQNRPARYANAGGQGIGAARAFTVVYNCRQPRGV